MHDEAPPATLRELFALQGRRRGAQPAILAPGRAAVSYAELARGIERAGAALGALGLGRGQRIATALPDGRDAGLAMLAAMTWSTCAPLDRRLDAATCANLFAQLGIDALIVEDGDAPAAAIAARTSGVPLLHLAAVSEGSEDLFVLRAESRRTAVAPAPPRPDDVALVAQTSGTTARPRVVPITQRALVAIGAREGIGERDRFLCISPLCTTSGIGNGLTVPLRSGATTVLCPGFDATRFFEWLEAFQPTFYSASPTVHAAIADALAARRVALPVSLRFVRSSSNGMTAALQQKLEAVLGVPVIQGYGSTEAGLIAQDSPLPGRRRAGSVGQAVDGNALMILGDGGRALPPGHDGEILVRGPAVMRGYENDPEANRLAFHDGWLRTGDVGHLDADGYLYVSGRVKEMINRGGRKVAPAEVDAALAGHPAVQDAASVAIPHPSLGEDVVCAVVLRSGADATAAELRTWARAHLAPYKVPSAVVLVRELPRNALGKVQRTTLAGTLADSLRAEFVAPRDADETLVARIFAAVLGAQRVGARDDFFLQGGDSLSAVRVLARIAADTGVELAPDALFEAPTVEELARRLASERNRESAGESAGGAAPVPTVTAAVREAGAAYVAPAAFGQRQLWVLDRLLPGTGVYNEGRADRLTGELDVAALGRALDEIVRRHDVLRTSFALVDGELCQIVAAARPAGIDVEDLSALSQPEREAEARRRAQAELVRPFDLARGPLFRARLLRLAPGEHWLLLTLHHIAADRWSAAVLSRELSVLHAAHARGECSPLPELPVQVADYAAWQRGLIAGERLERLLGWWTGALAGLPALALRTDRARPAVASFRGGRVEREIGAALARGLADLGRRENATPFMVLLAGFYVLLHRWSGQDDIAVGVPLSRRTRPELEGLIGYLVNMTVLRGDLRGEPAFTTLLERVRRFTLDAFAHGDLPIEKLVESLASGRDLSRNSLYQVTFRLGNTPAADLELPGVGVTRIEGIVRDTAKFDLALAVYERGGGLRVLAEFATDLFDEATIARMLDQYCTLLAAGVTTPDERVDRLPMLGPREREQLLVDWNRTAAPYPDAACVHTLVEAAAARAPAAPAIVDGERTVTYGELDAGANRLARLLRQRAGGPAPRIGFCLERGADLVLTMLAILKTGGAYVPLDPDLPAERLAFMVRDAGVALVVTTTGLLPRLPPLAERALCLDREAAALAAQQGGGLVPAEGGIAHPDSAAATAYVMYTSGSTGTPKGVAIPHRAVARLVCGTDYVTLDATDAVAHAANPAFDAATFEVWGALVNGARIVVVPRLTALSPQAFAAMLERSGITTLFVTTALFNQIAQVSPRAFRHCRTVLFGGEAVEPRWVNAVLEAAPPARLLHVYGPTETTTFATWHPVRAVAPDALTIPIGRPIANTVVYVLDRYGEPVPVGVPGELHIGGPGLAEGYLGRPDLTVERFVRDPFSAAPGARLYRTGDRVRYGADGAIEFLGRLDRQVKIRGHRIELDEVEALIARLPQVREAAVVLHGDTTDTRQLVAYLVATDPAAPPPANLWRDLKLALPAWMLPARIVWLKSLPLTASGKVDRNALPSAGAGLTPAAGTRVAPRDMFEQVIAGIWERVLGVGGIGVFDHFFEHGGHSLLAARLMDEIERETGCAAPLRALFADDTVAGIARLLREGLSDQAAPIVAFNAGGSRPPLVFLHGDLSGGGFYCRPLAHGLGADQPLVVVHPHTLDGGAIPPTIEAMAADRIAALRAVRPHGPWCLGGFCNGALIAFEMARQLAAQGESVPLVIVVQARAPRGGNEGAANASADGTYMAYDASGRLVPLVPHDHQSEMQLRYSQAIDRYAGGRYGGRLAVVAGATPRDTSRDLGWSRFAASVEVHDLPGDHVTLVTRHVGELAETIRGAIDVAIASALTGRSGS
jgi:amino acid adenylation domain-containing protein